MFINGEKVTESENGIYEEILEMDETGILRLDILQPNVMAMELLQGSRLIKNQAHTLQSISSLCWTVFFQIDQVTVQFNRIAALVIDKTISPDMFRRLRQKLMEVATQMEDELFRKRDGEGRERESIYEQEDESEDDSISGECEVDEGEGGEGAGDSSTRPITCTIRQYTLKGVGSHKQCIHSIVGDYSPQGTCHP